MSDKGKLYECVCGKSFRVTNHRIAADHYCSIKCRTEYSWYGRHAWIFNKPDLKATKPYRRTKQLSIT